MGIFTLAGTIFCRSNRKVGYQPGWRAGIVLPAQSWSILIIRQWLVEHIGKVWKISNLICSASGVLWEECQTYNRLGKNACTSHKIEARDLYNLVLKDIQDLAAMALKDADVFYQRLSSRMERRYMADASEMQKECDRLEARNQEIDSMFMSLYTDKTKGILTEQRFLKLTATLEQEQEANRKRIQELALVMRRTDEQESDVRTFMQEIRRYVAIQELDEAVLNRLISKILVGEVRKMDGHKCQEVKIVYNFVGEISI